MSTPRIVVLPTDLADQIAAGEVIERPASVVKELAENSLDAGARRIDIDLTEGGLGLIRVIDDGGGMSPEEAHLALLRHATSKLRALGDLFSLRTMGFRGEALPSIAAVSRFALTTRSRDSLAGYRLEVEGGKERGPGREVGAPVGTQIEVKELLYNVPARLKFMKGDGTETGHSAEAVLRLALAAPQVHLRLRSGNRTLLDLPPHGTALERAQAALQSRGRAAGAPRLYKAAGQEGEVVVEAYVGAPSDATTTPRNVYLMVNGRYIRDRSLLHALVMGYGELLDRGRYPLAVLYLQLPGDAVDINVHPQKLEVRFRDPQRVYAAVRHAVRDTALAAPWLLGARPNLGTLEAAEARPLYARPLDDQELQRQQEPEEREEPEAREEPLVAVAGGGGVIARGFARPLGPALRPNPPLVAPPVPPVNDGRGLAEHRARYQQAQTLAGLFPDGGLGGTREAPRRAFFSAMSYLGQLLKTYLVCEHEGEMVLIDQHAAHESLAFQRLRTGYQGGKEGPRLAAQRLLFPLSLELDAQRAALVEEEGALLAQLGFELRPFGGRSFALVAGPDTVEYGRGAKVYQDPETVLHKVLDDLLAHGRSEVMEQRLDLIFATIACHSVVRAGDVLDEMKARALLQSMDEVDFVPHCPHGRPVLVRLPRGEIERRFGRVG